VIRTAGTIYSHRVVSREFSTQLALPNMLVRALIKSLPLGQTKNSPRHSSSYFAILEVTLQPSLRVDGRRAPQIVTASASRCAREHIEV